MSPLLRALLTSWDLRPEILLTLAILGGLFTLGWWRIRTRSRQNRLAAPWRLAAYWSGLIILAIALMSGIDILSGQLFFMHMIQHLLLVMIVPPLILLTNPFPFLLWGLPPNARRWVGGLFVRDSGFRNGLKFVTRPQIVWIAFVGLLLMWHDPNLYNLALTSDRAHDLEHLSFFVPGMFFWWNVTGAGPRLHGTLSPLVRIAFVLLAVPPNFLLGAVIGFSTTVIYTFYESVPRFYGISTLADQQLAGFIMWVPGSMMYIIAALVLLATLLGKEDDKPVPTVDTWTSDQALIAPGLEHRATQARWRQMEAQKAKARQSPQPHSGESTP